MRIGRENFSRATRLAWMEFRWVQSKCVFERIINFWEINLQIRLTNSLLLARPAVFLNQPIHAGNGRIVQQRMRRNGLCQKYQTFGG